ncbi:YHYH domain-containing protein [Psychrobacter maritimus]|nr:YHYH domain-containing protein [Psychrobacter sp. WB2]WGV11936.1 YHYH domain-containing protein [Psychrobacter sp. WB2]
MKKLLIVVFTVTFASAAFAHGGGTNSAGCHNDTKRGTYHCH